MEDLEKDKGIQIEIDDATAEGCYANLSFVGNSSSEFIIDFVRLMPNLNTAKVKSRVILAPENGKRLAYMLQEAIRAYENKFGEIRLEEEANSIGFSSIRGEA